MTGSSPDWPYDLLGLEDGETDRKAIRRAYAIKLKTIDPAASPREFQTLREAYQAALAIQSGSFGEELRTITQYEGGTTEANGLTSDGTAGRNVEILPFEAHHEDEAAEAEIERLLESISQLESARYPGDELERLLDDPLLQNPSLKRRIEAEIYASLMQHSWMPDNGELVLPDYVNARLARILDNHFQWLSDYRAGTAGSGTVDEAFFWALLLRSDKFSELGLLAFDKSAPDLLAFRVPGMLTLAVLVAYVLLRDLALVVFYSHLPVTGFLQRGYFVIPGIAYPCLEFLWLMNRPFLIRRLGLRLKPPMISGLYYTLSIWAALGVIGYLEISAI